MSNPINTGLAFLAGAGLVDSIENDVNKVKTKIKIEALERELAEKSPAGVAARNNRITTIAQQIAANRAEDVATINALKRQVQEMRELAHAWEKRAVVMEAKHDTWKDILRNLLANGEITIAKDEVQQRFSKYYNALVEANLNAMRAKRRNF
jgi:MoxR-like ATPase